MLAKKTKESDKFKDFIKCFDATEGLEKDTLVAVLKQLLDDAYHEGRCVYVRYKGTSRDFVNYFCNNWDEFVEIAKKGDASNNFDEIYLRVQFFCEKFFELGRVVGEAECLNTFGHYFLNAEHTMTVELERLLGYDESEE